MIIALASVKGSPGVTSTALALAATWPSPVVLLEADPSGGDLAFRCRAAHGGSLHSGRSVISLAAAVRAEAPSGESLTDHSQRLSCRVDIVQGLASASQADGLTNLWPRLAETCRTSNRDVIVDLGRLDQRSPVLPLARAAARLMVVANPTLASVLHVSDALTSLASAASTNETADRITPVLVGPDGTAVQDRADFDDILARTAVRVAHTRSLPYDPEALQRLESGDPASGRLGRTLLIRAARQLASEALADRHQVSA